MKAALLAAFCFGAVIATPRFAEAHFVSGNRLYEWCTADRADELYWVKEGQCTAFILGTIDAMEAHESVRLAMGEQPLGAACLPARATAGQLRDVVVQHIRNDPKDRHENAAGSVLLALILAYPCDQS
ncbi:Rap1a/Tai family immunity protein [Brevundimonas olei]|uniref:Rap1a/Tai family immunity protein n=1 Tax=Brevundimonas olei TaxID=657642 RepID=UPI0033727610